MSRLFQRKDINQNKGCIDCGLMSYAKFLLISYKMKGKEKNEEKPIKRTV